MFVQISHSLSQFIPCRILRVPDKYGETHNVAYSKGDIHEHGHWELFDYNPQEKSFPNGVVEKKLPAWIIHNCNAKLFLPSMD